MLRRGVLVAMAAVTALVTLPAHAQEKPRELTFAGVGGQTATLDVGPGGSEFEFPWFGHPRLNGPDGTVSGVLIERRGVEVGGAVLLNAPGFDEAVVLPLGGTDGIHLQ